MKNTNKKGFTIVELVIVIAVIAILAAVLIPTFVGLVNKANIAADQQAVNQMNKALAMNDALEGTDNILDVFAALDAAGMTAKNYKPLAKDMYFFYDADLKKVLYVDKDMKVVAPEEHKDLTNTGRTWLSLTQTIATKAPEGYTVSNKVANVEVTSGAEMLYVLDDVKKGNVTNATITVPAEGIDMMGATFGIGDLKASVTIKAEGDTPVKIHNATAVDVSKKGDGKTPGADGQYGTSLFGTVASGKSLKIENVVFENVHVKNTHAGNVAILVSLNQGTVELNNVTIKNSSVIGWRNTGALVGNAQGTIKVNNVTLENVDVKTVGGRSGMVFGMMSETAATNFAANTTTGAIKLTNCSYSFYECEQNTGTYEGATLGLKDGVISSWAFDGTGGKEFKGSDKGMNFATTTLVSENTSLNPSDLSEIIKGTVTGWN